MSYIQILLIIFFIFAGAKAVFRYQKNDLSLGWLVLWLLFWLAAMAVTVLPDSTAYFAKLFGVGRGADLVVYISLALLFFVNFQLYTRVEKMDREITRLTRELALKNVSENNL